MNLIYVAVAAVFLAFFAIVFRGAPFVPTRARDLDALFKLHRFKKGDLLVDLGSGDGRVLLAAANRGIRSVGYELNPFLALYARWRLRPVKELAQVRLGDFWSSRLPADTTVVFVFLAGPFMTRLDRKLSQEALRLGQDIVLISYGITMPGKPHEAKQGAFVTYRYRP